MSVMVSIMRFWSEVCNMGATPLQEHFFYVNKLLDVNGPFGSLFSRDLHEIYMRKRSGQEV